VGIGILGGKPQLNSRIYVGFVRRGRELKHECGFGPLISIRRWGAPIYFP
jgi:hypothetical protein